MTSHLDPDYPTLRVLADFARVEVASRDVEPWADTLAWLRQHLENETHLWLVALYNTYDSLGSAWAVLDRWPSPIEWAVAEDADEAALYECTQERRNLRGGLVLKRHDSYVAELGGNPQGWWLAQALVPEEPELSFTRMTAHLRRVWGVGRQAAFEWAEFLGKAAGFALTAPHAQLWESEGPRRSLQRLYGNASPTAAWLDAAAIECRSWLASEGVALSWEDFETVICDFNVMRDGRYYPGRHLAALREEIDGLGGHGRTLMEAAWQAVVPAEWAAIPPGIDPAKLPVYRNEGRLLVTP